MQYPWGNKPDRLFGTIWLINYHSASACNSNIVWICICVKRRARDIAWELAVYTHASCNTRRWQVCPLPIVFAIALCKPLKHDRQFVYQVEDGEAHFIGHWHKVNVVFEFSVLDIKSYRGSALAIKDWVRIL